VLDEPLALAAAIGVQKNVFCNKALNFETLAKHKRTQDEEGEGSPDLFDATPYSPFFKKDEEAPITEVEHVVGMLARLDQGIATNSDTMITLVAD
jgi:hypothetical protein